jgi:hypothetical protein
VSDGNVLVADLLRLSAALPPALAGGASPSAPVLFDFRYLKDPEGHERRVEADRQLAALDDRFREACWLIFSFDCDSVQWRKRHGLSTALCMLDPLHLLNNSCGAAPQQQCKSDCSTGMYLLSVVLPGVLKMHTLSPLRRDQG